ncbi:hypothetical protein DEA8626_03301 [Defluviimonas aquaemixtae]|uniref:Type I secretion protein n=1 Tax=Albidovulum aquaemixtae TaxID=1542388 RepID=A0A2R8BLK0_9RHOB|nr:hypothetical protein [Defluviimonas aquaemixtae]SPH24250.1 hypothetical protein DEA8626_03301 [Defluviimonas aquaemixtae]
MPLDRTTEAIAHFIGFFHLDTEAARMRAEYDAFRGRLEDAPEPGDLPEFNISVRAPYDLNGFDPGLKGLPSMPPAAEPSAAPVLALAESGSGGGAYSSSVSAEVSLPEAAAARAGPAELELHWYIPPPNSIVTVTVQSLTMSDNDLLTFGHGYEFIDPSVFTAELMELAEVAQELSLGISEIMEPGHVPSVNDVLDVFAEAMNLDGSAVEGAKVTVVYGEDANGIYVNGERVEEMPDFRENLPKSMREDEDEASEDDAEDNPFAVEPGHHVSTGENLSTNEAYIGISWVDADVIAVAGDVVRLDLISQVNVLINNDSGYYGGSPSHAINAAQIQLMSSQPADAATPAAADDPVFPRHWQVERIDGDVVLLNWLQQHIFATDNDRAEIEFSGSNTSIGLGGNTLGNFASLVELGFYYDLIIVGGNMITFNFIEQINVLLDSDAIEGAEWATGGVESGDNYLQNSATISTTGIDTVTAMTDLFRAEVEALANGAGSISATLAGDALFEGKDTLSVLYISGDLIKVNALQQLNYVGDADQVNLALEDFVAANGDVTVNTGSNALLNDAYIEDAGIDSVVLAGGDVYSDALIYQAELIDTNAVPDGVALAALTNEAVAAFLASDMIDPDTSLADDGAGAQPMSSDSGSLDVMQSVLA